MIDPGLKQSAINAYLAGGFSLRGLGKKYGINYKTIHGWVLAHQRQEAEQQTAASQTAILHAMNEASKQAGHTEVAGGPAAQIKELQKQLAQERLHNKLLTAMIDVAEEELKIPIRKKYGTRQSSK